jgi:GTPase SAR1 family protein
VSIPDISTHVAHFCPFAVKDDSSVWVNIKDLVVPKSIHNSFKVDAVESWKKASAPSPETPPIKEESSESDEEVKVEGGLLESFFGFFGAQKKPSLDPTEHHRLKFKEVSLENELIVNVWDCGGQKEYYPAHQLFLHRNTVVLLAVSIADHDGPEERLVEWLRILKSRDIPASNLILLFTKADKCSDPNGPESVVKKALEEANRLSLQVGIHHPLIISNHSLSKDQKLAARKLVYHVCVEVLKSVSNQIVRFILLT